MSEKRHASLDAKNTDTYQRNKKLRFVDKRVLSIVFLFFKTFSKLIFLFREEREKQKQGQPEPEQKPQQQQQQQPPPPLKENVPPSGKMRRMSGALNFNCSFGSFVCGLIQLTSSLIMDSLGLVLETLDALFGFC